MPHFISVGDDEYINLGSGPTRVVFERSAEDKPESATLHYGGIPNAVFVANGEAVRDGIEATMDYDPEYEPLELTDEDLEDLEDFIDDDGDPFELEDGEPPEQAD